MITSNKFKGVTEFERRGVVNKLVIPKGLKKEILYDTKVDKEKHMVEFIKGDSVYLITDKFGILDSAEVNVFFINEGVVLEILNGKIYLEGKKGTIYGVDNKGEISYPSKGTEFWWLTEENMRSNTELVTSHTYNVYKSDLSRHVNNLVYTVNFRLDTKKAKTEGAVFTTKYTGFYIDLGLGEFEYNISENSGEGSEEDCVKGGGNTDKDEAVDSGVKY